MKPSVMTKHVCTRAPGKGVRGEQKAVSKDAAPTYTAGAPEMAGKQAQRSLCFGFFSNLLKPSDCLLRNSNIGYDYKICIPTEEDL